MAWAFDPRQSFVFIRGREELRVIIVMNTTIHARYSFHKISAYHERASPRPMIICRAPFSSIIPRWTCSIRQEKKPRAYQFVKMSTKRKIPPTTGNANGSMPKKIKASSLKEPHPFHQDAEEHGIVLRKFYPHEMSNARALAYNDNKLPRPIEQLQAAQRDTMAARRKAKVGDAVVHWFKMDLRMSDNTALSMASLKAKEAGVPLICMYIASPEDWEAHLTGPIRVDFMLRTLVDLRADLANLEVPLYMETVEKRKNIPSRIAELMDDWGSNHLFANMEYEVDELRREAKIVKLLAGKGKSFEVVHDTCVVPPGKLSTGTGRQYAVYSPWYRSWMAHIHSNLDLLEEHTILPFENPGLTRQKFKGLFDMDPPKPPASKQLSAEEAKRFRAFWPSGEHEAEKRLKKFCEERIGGYGDKRNFPWENGTSSLSVHLASGTISARACIRAAREHNTTKKLDSGKQGIQTWISEVAWRDFYKHVLVNWPYVW